MTHVETEGLAEACELRKLREQSDTFKCGHPISVENACWRTRKPNGHRPIMCRACSKAYQMRDECRNGHKYTEQNTKHGKKRYCLTCVRLKRAKGGRPIKDTVPAPIQQKDRRCGLGHVLDGVSPTTGKRYCKKCQRTRTLEWNERKKLGLPMRQKNPTYGMSFEDKITYYTRTADVDGCVLWSGPVYDARNERPVMFHEGSTIQVRRLMWERTHPEPIPHGMAPFPICGKPRCVRGSCLQLVAANNLRVNEKTIAAANAKRRFSSLTRQDKYVLPALDHVSSVRKMLQRHFGGLAPYHEDIIQRVLLSLYIAWARDRREIANLHAVMVTAAQRMALDLRRKSYIKKEISLTGLIEHHVSLGRGRDPDGGDDRSDVVDADFPAPAECDPAQWLLSRELEEKRRTRLLHRLRAVPPKARRALRLQIVQGLSQKEIAHVLKITENTVEQHLTKARRIVMSIRTNRRSELLLEAS